MSKSYLRSIDRQLVRGRSNTDSCSISNLKKQAKKLKRSLKGAVSLDTHTERLNYVIKTHTNDRYTSWDELQVAIVKRPNNAPHKITFNQLLFIKNRFPRLGVWGAAMCGNIAYRDYELTTKDVDFDTFYKHSESSCHDSLFSHDMLESINRAIRFIKLLQPAKQINTNYDSYKLKHLAEAYFRTQGHEVFREHYLFHGAFIVAAFHQGYNFEQVNQFDKAVFFNFDNASITAMEDSLRQSKKQQVEA
ncbi:TPA: hypothetical protein N3C02_002503 [Vibrio parahaemolyticus]|uniref:hypothetical protein n=1 Tax=Vibrio parahaemolyticus TaxID=670 RepID=UPI001A1D3DAE|nr:hypothetical protein [Vibrio parahaemolyticus]HAS6725321.1 hypothetical protein [Vibrio parahaemolyticus]HAS6783576.1 hypothetical protein [Vibrio parahaemolyticus]HAS6791008.1 hypothetical protein [Vibrio parahaemolyticus]HAS6895028.1 hypothetical protein [Vibrio parahaemolyticus]HAS6898009.1 hypothetical protein [Vibrio parahaemolyticus]